MTVLQKSNRDALRRGWMIKTGRQMNNMQIIAGLDEVGRGCLAGPMVVVVALFNSDQPAELSKLTDSKKLTEKRREALFPLILKHVTKFGIGWVEAQEIDEFGISTAWQRACNEALTGFAGDEHLIVDGIIPVIAFHGSQQTMPKADLHVWQVSAASVLAKVLRDREMCYLAKYYPDYMWEKNKGYGTKEHMAAVKKLGITPFHRRSFLKRS